MQLIDVTDVDETSDGYQLAHRFFTGIVGYDYIPNGIISQMVIPEVGAAMMRIMQSTMNPRGHVSQELKMMLSYLTSEAAGCTYCQTNTYEAGLNAAAASPRIQHIWDYQTHPSFSAAERAALDLAVAAAATPSRVTDELRAAMREHWTNAERAEILATIASFAYFNCWNDANGTSLEQHVVDVADEHLVDRGVLDAAKYASLKEA